MAYQIQILGLRDYVDKKTNKTRKSETFHNKNWRVDTEEEIFTNPLAVASKVPESEQTNIYWTVARCFPDRGRKLAEQWLLQWDIDDVAPGKSCDETKAAAKRHAEVACEVLGIRYDQTGVIFSGNGVQFFIKLKTPILSEDYFDSARDYYAALVSKLRVKFTELNMPGKVDPSVFSPGRLMRLPNTWNAKPGREKRLAEVLQSNLEAIEYDLVQRSGLEPLAKGQYIPDDVLKRYPTPDTKAVLAGCLFMKWNFEKPQEVKEFQWYAGLSISTRLENGNELSHQMSEGHPGYNFYETELKIEQALNAAGPRTCKNIAGLWEGCKQCPHYNTQLVSPIRLMGPDYIKTKDTGFRKIKQTETGPVSGPPDYDDLIKEFAKEFHYVCVEESEIIWVFNGKYWQPMPDIAVKSWAAQNISGPTASTKEVQEFLGRVKLSELRKLDWMDETTERRMNFQNGILDLNKMELLPHSMDYGFTSVLPYAYDPRATSPLWDQYLKDATNGDPTLIDLLEQFGGYAIAGGQCYAQKALILLGKGGNGKSVYPETLGEVVGAKNHSTLMLNDLHYDQKRALLVNKLFNFGDESPTSMKTEMLKTLVTGGMMTVKEVYQKPYETKNKAKFIILANKLPSTTDLTDGFYDRLLIANFDVKFRGTVRDDKKLKYKMWETELPGICNRLIEGYKRLSQNQYVFAEPEKSVQAREEYRAEYNNVLRFVQEKLTFTGNDADLVSKADMYNEYVSHCKSEEEKPFTKIMFFKEFRECVHGYTEGVICRGGNVTRAVSQWTMKRELDI